MKGTWPVHGTDRFRASGIPKFRATSPSATNPAQAPGLRLVKLHNVGLVHLARARDVGRPLGEQVTDGGKLVAHVGTMREIVDDSRSTFVCVPCSYCPSIMRTSRSRGAVTNLLCDLRSSYLSG